LQSFSVVDGPALYLRR